MEPPKKRFRFFKNNTVSSFTYFLEVKTSCECLMINSFFPSLLIILGGLYGRPFINGMLLYYLFINLTFTSITQESIIKSNNMFIKKAERTVRSDTSKFVIFQYLCKENYVTMHPIFLSFKS